jgi:alpha-glucosidase
MPKDNEWWRGAIFYQIYPRSFFDSNDDGIGDLAGIASKLDYIKSLEVDGIWISPFFKSPMKDFGYDVSSYREVDPIFGENKDFDDLLEKAHSLDIKVIIDMVLSHTSDEHPWFKESQLNRENDKADWYVWADPKADGSPPNNWQSIFGGSAWSFHTGRGQYYMHNFLKEQPDLNYHNPAVQEALLKECKFWLEKGLDGFRLDTVNFYIHDKNLRDNPAKNTEGTSGTQIDFPEPYNMQEHIYDKSQPENLLFIEKLRELTDQFGSIMMVGEIGDDDMVGRAIEYTEGNTRLHTAYNFSLLGIKDSSAPTVREHIENFEARAEESWPSWALSNHDVIRTVSRVGKESGHEKNPEFAKLYIALLLSLRGTIFMYQGEELGLSEAQIPYEKLQDPFGKYLWPEWQGRDGCRTPIPWNGGLISGFSKHEPWLPIPLEHTERCIDKQEKNNSSVLTFTREFIKWRKTNSALVNGDIAFIDTTHKDSILAFNRQNKEQSINCFFNLSNEKLEVTEMEGNGMFELKGKKENNKTLLPFEMYFTQSSESSSSSSS